MHCIFKFVLTKDAIWYIIQSTRIVMFYVFLNINLQVLYMHCTCCTMNYVNLCLDNDCMIIPPNKLHSYYSSKNKIFKEVQSDPKYTLSERN